MYSHTNMSDEDRDIDIESDEEDDDGSIGTAASLSDATAFMTQAEKRAHHNALERKRRDHIKDSFHSLRDSVPALHGEKVNKTGGQVSRAQILKKAADYIQFMRKKNHNHQSNIDELKKQNNLLEQQIRGLEKARSTGQFATQASSVVNSKGGPVSAFDGGSGSESSNEEDSGVSRQKKLKVAE